MKRIKTNMEELENRIVSEYKRAFHECKKAADSGRMYHYFTTDRDIQRDVRNMLEEKHGIFVPFLNSLNGVSTYAVEHTRDKTEMKLKWQIA